MTNILKKLFTEEKPFETAPEKGGLDNKQNNKTLAITDTKIPTSVQKEFINSAGVLFVSILVNFLLQFVLALFLGPLFFFFNFIPFIIGPLVLVIFIIRGIRLFRKTRRIQLVVVSVAAPFLIFVGLTFVVINMYPDLKNLPINLFQPETNFVIQKIKTDKLNEIASNIEVNPAKICVTRKDYGKTYLTGRTGNFWMYKWVIEWQGAMKFPQIDGDIGHFYSSINNLPGGSGASFEVTGGVYQIIDEHTGSKFPSDGNLHNWKVDYQPNDINGEVNTINFYFMSKDQSALSEKSYYTLIIPESLIQKIKSIGEIDNTPGYTFEEYYTRPLTEMERLVGEVCVNIK